MVYVKEDSSIDVTDSYMKVEGDTEYAVVEGDGGYFIYKIPVVDAPDYADVDGKVLDFATSDMKIIEAPDQSNRSEWDGMSEQIVPQKVADEAEKVSGATTLD